MSIKWPGQKAVHSARAWASGNIPAQSGKDECVVCGKQIRRHRAAMGDGRVCSLTCAQYWAEKMMD
ncbi:hypothetical protein [Goodfellowiella coeruleoviolacea]|uniref:Uncharacterized protein n=1 Tax=Goodfellowiella coeruleoviolacea TaxID=334858 RepID=A0AAE3GGN4_9PSEU|nr:hypothetical protein [Goodfellowiella coeruleoviolacea]MCP2167906.1 hypothetical protein [Goodfellowiella coeruleoviolacea]